MRLYLTGEGQVSGFRDRFSLVFFLVFKGLGFRVRFSFDFFRF